jgi:glycosyltransferase involved in cell wall biosynthesis
MNRRPIVVQTFTVPQSLRFIEGQPHFWHQNGYDVHILTANGPDVYSFLKNNVATIYLVPFRRKYLSWLTDFYCLYLLFRYFAKHRPAILHANTPKAAFLSLIAAWFTRVPVRIYELHGLPLETAPFFKGLLSWMAEKIACSLATEVIAVSASLRCKAIENKVVISQKIRVINNGSCNGIETETIFNPSITKPVFTNELRRSLSIPEHATIVGFVGRLTADKGIEELYNAWQNVKPNHPHAILLMIGEVDEREKINSNLLRKINADTSIRSINRVKNIAVYYELMDFLVLPTHREGLGNVILEAASMQKPCIGSKVTGVKNAIVDHQTGLFCSPRSVKDLAEKIDFYLSHPMLVKTHGVTARNHVRLYFQQDDVWMAKLHLYQSCLKEHISVPLQDVPDILETTY